VYKSLRQYGITRASIFADLENLGVDLSKKWRKQTDEEVPPRTG